MKAILDQEKGIARVTELQIGNSVNQILGGLEMPILGYLIPLPLFLQLYQALSLATLLNGSDVRQENVCPLLKGTDM